MISINNHLMSCSIAALLLAAFAIVGSAQKLQCVAHRGASAYYPENTLAAFREAERQGANGFEFDLRITADKVPVLLHDGTLDRTTNCTGNIHTVNYYGYVENCWADGIEKVLTLTELLDYVAYESKMFSLFDIKDSALVIPYMADILNAYPVDLTDRLYLAGQVGADVEMIKEYAPRFMRSIVASIKPDSPTDHDLVNYNMNFGVITPEFVQEANAAGITVFGWTINDVATMQSAIDMNLDAILTDYPDVYIELRDNQGKKKL